jgi:hypothetical protein
MDEGQKTKISGVTGRPAAHVTIENPRSADDAAEFPDSSSSHSKQ